MARFRKQQQILLPISSDILLNPEASFGDIHNCYIAQAIKEYFGQKTKVRVSTDFLRINDIRYDIQGNNGYVQFLKAFIRAYPQTSNMYNYKPEFTLTIVLKKHIYN